MICKLLVAALSAVLTYPTITLAAEGGQSSFRRVVTGLDDSGKAVVLFDTTEGATPKATTEPVAHTLWTLGKIPATSSMKEDNAKLKLKATFTPSPGVLIFRTVDFPPAPPPEVLAKMDVNLLMKVAGDEAPKKGRPPVHPFTHRTNTIDMAIVVSGEIDMVLDDSMVHLKPGDVVVQQETNHAWVNNGKEICRIAFVQVTANEP